MKDMLTVPQATALAHIASRLHRQLATEMRDHPDLGWTDIATAATVALRGLALEARQTDPALKEVQADLLLKIAIALGLGMPDQIVRVASAEEEALYPDGVIPARVN